MKTLNEALKEMLVKIGKIKKANMSSHAKRKYQQITTNQNNLADVKAGLDEMDEEEKEVNLEQIEKSEADLLNDVLEFNEIIDLEYKDYLERKQKEEPKDPKPSGNDPKPSGNDPKPSGNDPQPSGNDPKPSGNDPKPNPPAPNAKKAKSNGSVVAMLGAVALGVITFGAVSFFNKK